MLAKGPDQESRSVVLAVVAVAAWERQAGHERFLFKKGRPADHPSRRAWVEANNVWQQQVASAEKRATVR